MAAGLAMTRASKSATIVVRPPGRCDMKTTERFNLALNT